MAFLTHLANDVFVSYCHDDDKHAADEKGWVREFSEKLRIALSQHSGQGDRIQIWLDERLGGAEVFDKSISEALTGTGVVLALVSPSYLTSDYCGKEIGWFCDRIGPPGIEVGNFRRVFPVLLHEVEPERWPEICRGTSSYRFHDETGWPLDGDSREFKRQLRKLVKDLWRVLCELQPEPADEPAAAREPASPEVGSSPFRIFFAHPPAELAPLRKRLQEELERPGIELLPAIPPPEEAAAHADAAREAASAADLSVHLLGFDPGRSIEGADTGDTYPVTQLRVGLEHARSQLLLLTEGLEPEFIEDGDYRELIESLRARSAPEVRELSTERFEIAYASRGQMAEQILAKREMLLAAGRETADAGNGAAVFVDFDADDLGPAHQVVSYLDKKSVPWLMGRSADASLFEHNLQSAALLLLVFGAPEARDLVSNRLLVAQKRIALQRLPTRIGVYAAPPKKPREELRFGFDVVDGMEGFNASGIDDLLARALETGS